MYPDLVLDLLSTTQPAAAWLSAGLFGVAALAALAALPLARRTLTVLPVLLPEAADRAVPWMGFTGLSFGSGLLMLVTWGNRQEDPPLGQRHEEAVAPVRPSGSTQGAADRLESTLHPRPLFLSGLQVKLSERRFRQRPLNCLLMELSGAGSGGCDPELFAHGLELVGAQIARDLRREDRICRYGAHQFAVALADCPASTAQRIAVRVRANVETLVLQGFNRRFETRLSLRVGVASSSRVGQTAAGLLREAQRDLARRRDGSGHDLPEHNIQNWRSARLGAS